jgi:hypothetical protein
MARDESSPVAQKLVGSVAQIQMDDECSVVGGEIQMKTSEKIRLLIHLLTRQAHYVRAGDMKKAMEMNEEMCKVAGTTVECQPLGQLRGN